jgi:anaerobic nitric oxide reductase flavorubredoxin
MKLAHKIAEEIAGLSLDTRLKVFNISKTDKNDIMAEVFRSKAIAVGSPTVGQSILSSVGGWIDFLKELKFRNKKAAVFGCYGWSGESTRILREKLTVAGFDVVAGNKMPLESRRK